MESLESVGCGAKCSHVDRTGWRRGEWDGEPDRVDFRSTGLPCFLHRNMVGAWCGYVGVAPGHPWHGEHHEDVTATVHGGLTYSGRCSGHLCHVPEPGEPDQVWWFGFDTAHFLDVVPGWGMLLWQDGTYKSVEYAREATEDLARQIAEASEEARSPNSAGAREPGTTRGS